MLDGGRRGRHRPGLPELGRFLEPEAQRLELTHDGVDVVAQGRTALLSDALSDNSIARATASSSWASRRRRRSSAPWATVRSRVPSRAAPGARRPSPAGRVAPRRGPARCARRRARPGWRPRRARPAPRRGRCPASRCPSTRARRRRRDRPRRPAGRAPGPAAWCARRARSARGRPGPSEPDPATGRAARAGRSALPASSAGGRWPRARPTPRHPPRPRRARARRPGWRPTPRPASNTADGDVIASAIARGRLRSMRWSIRSEVGDDGREHLVDARRVAGVVRRRVGRLRDAPEDAQVGVLAVGDGEDAHRASPRPRCCCAVG